MALKEYRFNGRTFAFDEDSAPEGAELVGDYTVESPILFSDQKAKAPAEPAADEKAAEGTPANKAGRKPADKQDAGAGDGAK
ncbi:hypothetical protein SEA_BAJUNIPER_7 [Microbacterium phage BAjuniper]|nr:hypothetical protein SEA_BAJUNIPER_7 [Microbacterium phage BAjuniper]